MKKVAERLEPKRHYWILLGECKPGGCICTPLVVALTKRELKAFQYPDTVSAIVKVYPHFAEMW